MSGPKRIQRRREKGWRMPEGAVYVGRPTKWGNPFEVVWYGSNWTVVDENGVDYLEQRGGWADKRQALRKAVALYFMDFDLGIGRSEAEVIAALKGRDLACWCPLDAPCHADVLLDLANEDGGAS